VFIFIFDRKALITFRISINQYQYSSHVWKCTISNSIKGTQLQIYFSKTPFQYSNSISSHFIW